MLMAQNTSNVSLKIGNPRSSQAFPFNGTDNEENAHSSLPLWACQAVFI